MAAMLNSFRCEKLICALSGAAAVIIGKKVITSKKARQLAVTELEMALSSRCKG